MTQRRRQHRNSETKWATSFLLKIFCCTLLLERNDSYYISNTIFKSPPLIQSNKQILLRPNISMCNTLCLFQNSCPIRSFHTSIGFLSSVLFEREGNFPARNRKKEGTEDPHGMFPLIHDPLNISTHISLLFSSQTNFTTLHRGGEQVTTASTASHRYIQERIRRNEFRMREREREREREKERERESG